jgi:hypothetical protein
VARHGASPLSGSTFLVERYWPGIDETQLRTAIRRLERSVRAARAEGRLVEHAGSILLPVDQVVLSIFRADEEATVRGVNESAGMPLDRVAEVTAHGFP